MITDDRYREIMESLGQPNSTSLLQALRQVANECVQLSNKKRDVYLVGQHKDGSDWEVQGIFDLESKAVKACKNNSCFVMPIEANKEFSLGSLGELGYFPDAD